MNSCSHIKLFWITFWNRHALAYVFSYTCTYLTQAIGVPDIKKLIIYPPVQIRNVKIFIIQTQKRASYQPWSRRNEVGFISSTVNLGDFWTMFVCTTGCQEVCICPYHCDWYKESKPLQYWQLFCLETFQVLHRAQQNKTK